jgi:hypothetical protein
VKNGVKNGVIDCKRRGAITDRQLACLSVSLSELVCDVYPNGVIYFLNIVKQ